MTAVPLPQTAGERESFSVEFELEIPAQLFVTQDHWRSLQVMSRLQSPTERAGALPAGVVESGVSADRLRELALAVAHRVKTHRDEFARECFLGNCLMSRAPGERQLARMLALFHAVEADIVEARARLVPAITDTPQIVQERALVDEFVSNQFLEFLFAARRAVDEHLLRPGGPHSEALGETATAFEQAVREPLSREMAYRGKHRFVVPTSDHPEELERYLERASQLKKHFHELLFLAAETNAVEHKLRNYGTIVGAMIASMFGFVLNKTGFLGGSASLGIVAAALVGAVVYAMQDRIKDLGKTYVPSKLGKRYAQRITRLMVPPRGNTKAKLVSTIEDSFTAKLQSRPDLLNPELGACRAVQVVRYTSHGESQVQPELHARGITSLKQIFRYDLSWLFARLDDARKPVPVFATDGVRVAEAPRCYRMPLRVKLTVGDQTYAQAATAVIHKGGLERLELEAPPEARADAAPSRQLASA